MNWQEKVNNSELVYPSTHEDKNFRSWSLKKTTCDVSFYESYPIEDIDIIICTVLEKSEGIMLEEELATILGFNVIDDFDVSPKRYADKAELDIFREIVKPVFDWGLVESTTEEKIVSLKLTELGVRALRLGEKYRFFSGKKQLLENENIKPAESSANLFFPFYPALGESTDITNKSQIKYDEVKLEAIFDIEETALIKQHKLQSKEEYNIYCSEKTRYFDFGSCQIDIRLFKQGSEYFPAIFYNNLICIEATELLNQSDYSKSKDNKIEWGLYLKLIKDSNAILDFETIIPFEDLLDLDSLIKDTRLVWADNQLFQFIADSADANQWFAISNHCPIEVIKLHIHRYKDKWDWTSLSLHIDYDFLVNNATNYPWNFEIISSQEDISIEVIKTLLLVPELKEQEWDWEIIIPQLDIDFIKTNIDKIEFELSELTVSNSKEVQPLIVQYPDKKWDWIHISDEYELLFILDNILNFSKHILIKKIINRAFTSEEYIDTFCSSTVFESLITQAKETVLRDYSANQADYLWRPQLIDLLEKNNLLNWESGTYSFGFECNPHIEWTYDYFKQYHSKVTTGKGFSFISKAISDTRIVTDFPHFSWDWDVISINPNLINNQDFVLQAADKLNYAILIESVSGDVIEKLFEQSNLLTFLLDNPDDWEVVTQKCSVEFVRKYIDYNWDWAILTKRFCSSINIEALGNPKWIDKWDWKYLTRNLEIVQIYDNIDLYVTYWDWRYLTEILDNDFILSHLLDYNDYWDWRILLNSRLDKSDLLFTTNLEQIAICISKLENKYHSILWQGITHKFDYSELEKLVEQSNKIGSGDLYQWDYYYFYNLSKFDVRQYLSDNPNLVNWSALSSSEALNKAFFWDQSLFSYDVWCKDVLSFLKNDTYKWDFKGLSQLDSINWNDTFLKIQTDKWDWDYLSEFSGCFRKSEKLSSRFKIFSRYINYQILSKRTDSEITEKLLSENIDKNWDWDVLSENNSVKINIEFIKNNKEKQWNWSALSTRNDIELNNETLIELSDKAWNWEAIAIKTDITFEENLIEKISDKPFDWVAVSRHPTFIPSAKVLSLLKGKLLDWGAISKNPNLPVDILWDYRDILNWEFVTQNTQFDFCNTELLEKYQKFVEWGYISQSDRFEITIENLSRFKEDLVWSKINLRLGDKISEEYLEPFANVLNWTNVSKSMEIFFTEDLIEKYKDYWDWQSLKNNSQIKERLNTTLQKYKAEFNSVNFLERFDRTPCIYHFTHLFNAIDIIKSRKILSRNKAEGYFANSAGNLVARRSTAHNFARFYFRPQTPTQFYNECLGMDSESGYWKTWYYQGEHRKWKTYYPQARNLGLPKCPIPVFFKFDLKEVLMKMYDKCFYSTGNMQTNWARVEKVSENPNDINTEHLYSSVSDFENYKQYSQQELLVEEEFDFSILDSLEIICYNEGYVNLLKTQLGDDPICEKITSNGWDVFHRENRKLNFHETETEIHISSEYKDDAYISIQGQGLHDIQVLNPNNIKKETANEILAYPEIRFIKTNKPIEVHFVDLSIGKREWLIYKNIDKPKEPKINQSNWWNNLDYKWKREIYLNYQLSLLNTETYIYCLANNSFGLDYLFYYFTIDSSNTVDEKYLNIVDDIIKNGIEGLSISDITDICDSIRVLNIGGVNDLTPLPYFENLEILIIDGSTIKDFRPLKHSKLTHLYQPSEYPNNEIDFEQLKNEFPRIKVNQLELSDLYVLFYKDFGVFFNTKWDIEQYDIEGLLLHLEGVSEIVKQALNTKVRHYLLKEHCFLVCKNFTKYQWKLPHEINKNLFMVFLCLHDIGKPQAFIDGDKDNQYIYSQHIIEGVWNKLPFADSELRIVSSFLMGDCIGEYFQNKQSVQTTKETIFDLSKRCEMKPIDFFKIFMIYYQCDIASYTADTGGIKFLEHLFEYKDEKKVFDENEGLIMMSPKYWEMYKQLKNEIENGN